jgi:hypothetical protein
VAARQLRRDQRPGTYFTDLGEQAAGEITRLWAQMRVQAANPPGEDYLARVARLNALRKQAEEVVLADLILMPPERDAIESDRCKSGCAHLRRTDLACLCRRWNLPPAI